jgi:hypothetical protein
VLKRIAQLGGVLIFISGVVNLLLGVQVGAFVYEIYPGGRMGHVGILSGLVAMAMGVMIVHVAAPRLDPIGVPAHADSVDHGGAPRPSEILASGDRRLRRGALLVFTWGLLGAITGALYVGTLGMFLCCVAAGWALFHRET